ncbi:N-formylglutamate amidohydrolase [Methyloceanibacter caenitepidi]|uniref:N-formylglutamate deformylase n=1 Tax=Methyloceanibacter caenitepidi TaxID=1384459 RepID=A0A0A8K6Y4_9HYPH|nr:N-formylglutamate amidohydrolase [Methyloceanibacter caenitepidi]BAQ18546.1 N-formylglutamate deformylase [Methyloceanibacter caenitepidi]
MKQLEAEAIERELSPPFTVVRPAKLSLPLVFNSPHSGRVYPSTFLAASKLDALTLRRSEDAYVDELFSFAAALGAPLLHAHFPRAYLDVNREPYELDPILFRDGLPHYANTQSVRVVGGLGTIARIVSESEEIYREPLSVETALERINRLYVPYHETLAALLMEAKREFGFAVLIDCHSMPSSPNADKRSTRADFVLGDRFGTSCSSELTRMAARSLEAQGFGVALNKPYAGGYITEHYGRPHKAQHVLQIEINRALYMDETTFERTERFDVLRKKLETVIRGLMPGISDLIVPRAAAE